MTKKKKAAAKSRQAKKARKTAQTVNVSAAIGAGTAIPSPTIALRSYFSVRHLQAANLFVDLAQEEEKKESPDKEAHRAYSIGAVMSSVAFLEAAINELFQDAQDGLKDKWGIDDETWKRLETFWKAVGGERERLPLDQKFDAALELANARVIERGEETHQRFSLVLAIRNALVHYKPQFQSSDTPGKISKRLEGQTFGKNPWMAAGNPEFPDKFLGAGGATWAVESCRNFADEFFSRLGVQPLYKRGGL